MPALVAGIHVRDIAAICIRGAAFAYLALLRSGPPWMAGTSPVVTTNWNYVTPMERHGTQQPAPDGTNQTEVAVRQLWIASLRSQ